MKNIFKNKRRKIILSNKLSRYILYALGEIGLIVIGIGIALSANDYSEKQKAIKQSNLFLSGMLEDLASDTIQLNKMLKVLEKQLVVEDWLIKKEKYTKQDLDSINLSVSPQKWSFNINDRSFQNIQYTNGNKLSGYDSLYSVISSYYTITKNRIARNNELEQQKTNTPSEFQNIVLENLIIDSNAYQDYNVGAKYSSDRKNDETEQNIENVINSLYSIKTQNMLNDKYARHNYLYISLFLCSIEARQLSQKIDKTINLD